MNAFSMYSSVSGYNALKCDLLSPFKASETVCTTTENDRFAKHYGFHCYGINHYKVELNNGFRE